MICDIGLFDKIPTSGHPFWLVFIFPAALESLGKKRKQNINKNLMAASSSAAAQLVLSPALSF